MSAHTKELLEALEECIEPLRYAASVMAANGNKAAASEVEAKIRVALAAIAKAEHARKEAGL